MKIKIIILSFLLSIGIFAQSPPPEYYPLIHKADSLFKLKEYKNAGKEYSAAFKVFGNKGNPEHRYNAARAWALANEPDNAFDNLDRIIKKRIYTDYDTLLMEKDFKGLYNDKRWQNILELIKTYKEYKVPEGWFIAGTAEDRDKYLIGIAKGAGQDGKNAATLKVISNEITKSGFGNLMQNFSSDTFLNKRIRMSGYMKAEKVDWASFWLRVDQSGSTTPLSFDNMSKRQIKGTIDWKKYEIVLDVPEKATNIAFGIMLGGAGQIWVDNIKFEIVDKTVSVTDMYHLHHGPANLGFEK